MEGTQHLSPFKTRLGKSNSGWTQSTPSLLPTTHHRVGNERKRTAPHQSPIIFRSVFNAQSSEGTPYLGLRAVLLGHWGMPPRKQSILMQCYLLLAPQTLQAASHQGRGHGIKDAQRVCESNFTEKSPERHPESGSLGSANMAKGGSAPSHGVW